MTPDDSGITVKEGEQGELDFNTSRQGAKGRKPALATYKATLSAPSKLQVLRGDQVVVTVSGMDGEVLTSQIFECREVAFIDHPETEKQPYWLERQHKLKLAAS
jgi:hypothetical protein